MRAMAAMDLGNRVGKLARGVSSAQAAAAHARSLRPGEVLSDSELALAEEFEATLEAMFLMAAVDGEVAEDELQQLAASVQALVDAHGERIELDATLASFNGKLARDGWRARLEVVGSRIKTADARAFTFRMAAAVAFVDDHVAHAEAAAIDALAAALQLSPEESQGILRDVHEELFG